MELLDKLLKSYTQSDFLDKRLKVFEEREAAGRIGEDEFREAVKSFRERYDDLSLVRHQIHERLSVLLVSINDSKVAEAFREFTSEVIKFQNQEFKVDNTHLIIRAGNLHKALRDKLISIRDT